ncbi:hypothetical protein D3C87_1618830 [compost metagenome]
MIRFFITELPISPSSADAPITATVSGRMMRFICLTICSCVGRYFSGCGEKSTTIRTSAAMAPSLLANTGFRSSSEISGKSVTSCDTRSIMPASASRLAGSAPRTPLSTSAAAMPSSIDSASSLVAGAMRKVMSLSTSTSTPPRPKATSLPNDGSVTAPMMTSWPPVIICCTCTPMISALALYFLAFSTMVR